MRDDRAPEHYNASTYYVRMAMSHLRVCLKHGPKLYLVELAVIHLCTRRRPSGHVIKHSPARVAPERWKTTTEIFIAVLLKLELQPRPATAQSSAERMWSEERRYREREKERE